MSAPGKLWAPADKLAQAEETIARLQRELKHERDRVKGLLIDLENANVDLVVKRRQMSALKARVTKETEADPMWESVVEVFNHWQEVTRHKRCQLSEDRVKLIRARLKERTKEELMLACDGAVIGAYVDPNGKKHDMIELICRSNQYVERFMGHAGWESREPEAPVVIPDSWDRSSPEGWALRDLDAAMLLRWSADVVNNPDGSNVYPCPVCCPQRGRLVYTLHLDTFSGTLDCSYCSARPERIRDMMKPWLATVQQLNEKLEAA